MNNKKIFFFVLLLCIVPVLSIFLNSDLIHTHDGPVHLARMGSWYRAILDGQIPPRWASGLNYGFGSPVLIFMYPWPYFLSFIFLSLGLSLVLSFKLVMALSFVVSGLFAFAAGKELFKDSKKALLFFCFYQFFTFRFIEIVVRGSFGEIWSYSFVPLVLLGLARIKNSKLSGFLLIAIGTALLILSHNSVSLSFFAYLFIFSLIFLGLSKKIIISTASFVLGLMLSAFYWLPALIERKYTYGDLFMKDLYLEHFPSLAQLFTPNFFNAKWGQVGGISVQFGVIPLATIVVVVLVMLSKKIDKVWARIWIYNLLVVIICILLMQPISTILWEKFSLLRQFQFSWRLLSVVGLAISFLSLGLLKVKVINKTLLFYSLIFLTVISSAYYWRPLLGFDRINEEYYWNYPLNSTYFGEANTIWAGDPPNSYPESRIQVVSGQAIVDQPSFTTSTHRFTAQVSQDAVLLDNTIFFPGWRVFVDDQEAPVQFQNPDYRGLITFPVSQGNHKVEIKFNRAKDRVIGEALSVLGAIVVFLLYLYRYKINPARTG